MKTIYLLSFIFFMAAFQANPLEVQQINSFTAQEIQYSCAEAKEVFLVWGINSWCLPPKNICPQGTYFKDNLAYTPMKFKEGLFQTSLKVRANTLVNFVFFISKGPGNVDTEVWDVNTPPKKDYNLNATADQTTLIKSDLKVRPKEQLSILDFSWQLLLGSLFLCAIFFGIKKYYWKNVSLKPKPATKMIAFAAMLALALFLVRTTVLLKSWDLYLYPFEFMPQLLSSAFYDLIYVISITLIFLSLFIALRKYPRAKSFVVFLFPVVILFSLVIGILNIRIIQMLGRPFNYQWLYYSDFLLSSEAKSAMSVNVSSEYIFKIVRVCLAVIVGSLFLGSIIELITRKALIKKVLIVFLITGNLGYIIFAQKDLDKWNYDKVANPVTAFLESVNPFMQNPALFTMQVADSLKFSPKKNSKRTILHKAAEGKVKNVIMVVLESTAAEYIQLYGSRYKATPEIVKNFTNSIVFENIYAHVPATNKAFVCLSASVYPWLSYTSITQEHPDVKAPTISSELKKHGYRTAFFNSGDNNFQRMGEFLKYRNFDEVKDYKKINCNKVFAAKAESKELLGGVNDQCTGDELISWVKKEKDKPFFAMMWTYQTHYPYDVSGEEKSYASGDPMLNKYLNAVSEADHVIGKITDELKSNNLFESTLVLIIGDHGEAFGRHDQILHARRIYEENLHVPCILINPLFKGQRDLSLGGQVDIAPTIMHLLGLPAAAEWQGRSLFDEDKNKRVFFFCPWSDYLFGYRQGNRKYIFNANKNFTEIYDLKTDPNETRNLAPGKTNELDVCHQRLAGWVQYQNNFMDKLLKGKVKN